MRDPKDLKLTEVGWQVKAMRTAVREGDVAKAERIARELLASDPTQPDALRVLSRFAAVAGHYDTAIGILRTLEQVTGESSVAFDIGNLLFRCGRVAEAAEVVDAAIATYGETHPLLDLRAEILSTDGRIEEAKACLERGLELDPRHASHYVLATLTDYTPDHPHLQQMEAMLGDPTLTVDARIQANFGAATARDQLGDAERAFPLYAEGNRLRREQVRFDVAAEEANIRRITTGFDAELISEFSGTGHRDAAPVFIVGLPRGGSSLVEHFLAAHPGVHSIGETEELPRAVDRDLMKHMHRGFDLATQPQAVPQDLWARAGSGYMQSVRRMAPDAERIVDKQLFNDLLVGVIHLMLPEARFIHCRREPMAQGWSSYAGNFRTDRGFVYDLTELGRTYRLHEALMAHWEQLLPADRYMTMDYEALVADPEQAARHLVEFVGLPWDAACLEATAADRLALALSARQLRAPIRAGTGARWRDYESFLAPLVDALAQPVDPLSS